MQLSQIKQIGKYTLKIPTTYFTVNSRTKELLNKGYSKHDAQQMIYMELGLTTLSYLIMSSFTTPAAIEAGGIFGFETGFAIAGPQGAIYGGIAGAAWFGIESNIITGVICKKFSEDFTEYLFQNGYDEEEDIDLSKIPTLIKDNGPRYQSLELFNQAQSTQPIVVDPILLDLNGDGVIGTTALKDGVYFDHNGDKFAGKTSWVNKDDGILVIDKNNNGVIDDGSEVFGDNYVKSNGNKASSGFDALADLDSNGDGVISAEDSEFSNIKILKGDGSLISLEEAGIVSISLNNTSAGDDGNGIIDENRNTLVSLGSFVRGDGSIGSLGDFNLVVDKMDSVEVNEDRELKVA